MHINDFFYTDFSDACIWFALRQVSDHLIYFLHFSLLCMRFLLRKLNHLGLYNHKILVLFLSPINRYQVLNNLRKDTICSWAPRASEIYSFQFQWLLLYWFFRYKYLICIATSFRPFKIFSVLFSFMHEISTLQTQSFRAL